jgi:hypothetical protein
MTALAALRPAASFAVITQGDLSVFVTVETREAGRWGEGSSGDNSVPTTFTNVAPGSTVVNKLGTAATETGGSFDFNHWDLVEMRQVGGIRPDYHLVKDHKLLDRFEVPFLEDADLFAYYRPWYDAEGTLKSKGRAEAFRDYRNYTPQDIWQRYAQDNLHEYYAQLNFTENFSMRIGQQQIIWSEGNLLSGTDITNPGDASFHGFVGAESPEDARKALQMVKADYVLPDFLKTANNEVEGFVIPGDFQGASGLRSNLTLGLTQVDTDPRDPYAIPISGDSLLPQLSQGTGVNTQQLFNQEGQPVRVTSLLDAPAKPMVFANFNGSPVFFDFANKNLSHPPSKSIENSEFGVRYSSLLPVGDGLQTSLIFLYEARSPLTAICAECGPPAGFSVVTSNIRVGKGFRTVTVPGLFVGLGKFAYGRPRAGVPKAGTLLLLSTTDYRRNPYFGATGTYFDEDFTNAVFRYDALYAPRVAVSAPGGGPEALGGTFAKWTEISRLVFGIDRPTLTPLLYPYLTKQHTLFTFETTETFYPDLPAGAVPNDPLGKVRRLSTFLSLNATNFILNGRMVDLTGVVWDADDQTGQIVSSAAYRYTRNLIFGVNTNWYLGRSGRHTDPYLQSKSSRISELELTLTYEL